MNKSSLIKKQQGMTLIEMMIAMGLGVFLLAGVMGIFTSSKQSYRMLENLSRMQENGRFALDFMSRDIRQAGLRELCFEREIDSPIAGTNNDGAINGVNVSDSITVSVSEKDCPLSLASSLPLKTILYTVTNRQSSTTPVLYKRVIEDKNEDGDTDDTGENVSNELIEGIDNLQILYGEDFDNDNVPDYYLEAGSAGLTMDNVVSVRITLSARTEDNNLTDTGDGYLRRNFSTTIALRNKLP